MRLIQLRDIHKTYVLGEVEVHALQGVSLDIDLGEYVALMGPSGSGQLTKMVNQICIAGLIQGLAEGLNFAVKAGLDAGRVVETISKGAAQSWQMDNRAKTMIENRFDFGFAVDWMRKDIAMCLDEARACGAAIPVTALVDQFYARVQAKGGGRFDTSSLIAVLREHHDV